MISILVNQRQECEAQMSEETIENNYIQIVPTYNCLTFFFFHFLVMQKPYAFSTNLISNFEFWSFPGLTMCGRIFFHDARQQPWAQAPSQPYDHEDKQLIHLRHSAYRQPFCFSPSVQYTVSYKTYSTLLKSKFYMKWFCPTVGYCKFSEHV